MQETHKSDNKLDVNPKHPSHPQINGYYEMHLSYEDASALDRQLEMFRQGDVLKANSRYLFDTTTSAAARAAPPQNKLELISETGL